MSTKLVRPKPTPETILRQDKEPEHAATPKAPEPEPARQTNTSCFAKSDTNQCPCLYNIIPEVVERALPNVVSISVTQIYNKKDSKKMLDKSPFGDMFKEFFESDRPRKIEGMGSGFFIKAPDGELIIVTNYHVVADANEMTAYLADKTPIKVKLLARDTKSDLAILKVKDHNQLPKNQSYLEWDDSAALKVGEQVIAIGNPFGLGSTVTCGVISSLGRDMPAMSLSRARTTPAFIQHSAQINLGSSGGVLLAIRQDEKDLSWTSKVIGINTAILSPTGGNVGIGFATPSNVARSIIEQLYKYGKAIYGWLGVYVRKPDADELKTYGLSQNAFYVEKVVPGGPAEKAGIKPDDIILELDDKVIQKNARITDIVEKMAIGKIVSIKVLRNLGEEPIILKAKIEERRESAETPDKPEESPSTKGVEILGIKIANVTSNVCQRYFGKDVCAGVCIVDVDEASLLDLEKGDIILQVNKHIIKNVEDFVKIIERERHIKHDNVILKIKRKEQEMHNYVRIPLGSDQTQHKAERQ